MNNNFQINNQESVQNSFISAKEKTTFSENQNVEFGNENYFNNLEFTQTDEEKILSYIEESVQGLDNKTEYNKEFLQSLGFKESASELLLDNMMVLEGVKQLFNTKYNGISDNQTDEKINTLMNMSEDELNNLIKIANYQQSFNYPTVYNDYNFFINGQRLDSSFEGFKFEVGDKKINLYIDNNIISENLADVTGLNDYDGILNNATVARIQSALITAQEHGLEIPENYYISNLFGFDERLHDKAYAYSFGEYGIMFNASAIQDNDYLTHTIYHELAHYNDSLSGWLSKNCDIKVGEYIELENGETYNQKYTVKMSDGTEITPDDTAKCISDYASTDNLEFIAEVTVSILKGDIIKNPDGSYSFAGKKEEYNSEYKAKLNNIMNLYNYMTQGKIL